MLRFVVLHHEGFGDAHYDLMIEREPGGALITWRCPDWPIAVGDDVTRLGDHRREYLEYEGPVSNNRGHVRRVAFGDCEVSASDDQITVHLLDADRSLFILHHTEADRWRVVEVHP